LKNAGENAMPDHRRRRIEDPANYQAIGWLLVVGIAEAFAVVRHLTIPL
jgi:hypothetical protein